MFEEIGRVFDGSKEEKLRIAKTVETIAGDRYFKAFTIFRNTRQKDTQASAKAQRALRSIIVKNHQVDQKEKQSYFIKLWASVALDPRNKQKLEAKQISQLDPEKDAKTIQLAKLLYEIMYADKK